MIKLAGQSLISNQTVCVMTFRIFHSLLWLGGLFYGVVPFLWKHEFASGGSPYLGESHFGFHILIFIGLAATGSFLWGVLARFLNVELLHDGAYKRWFLVALLSQALISALGIIGVLTGYTYYLVGLSAVVVLAWLAFSRRGKTAGLVNQALSFGKWFIRSHPYNGVFYALILLLLLWQNYFVVTDIKGAGFWFYVSLMLNRFFNLLAIVGALYLGIQLSILSAPRWSRAVVWMISSFIPLAIIADYMMVGMWNTNFIDFVNRFGVEGLKNIEDELAGGGVPVSLLSLLAGALGTIAGLGVLIYGMDRLSKRWKMSITPLTAVVVIILGILGATLEQQIGKTWKQRKDVIREQNEFDVQLAISDNLPPLAGFDVEFRNYSLEPEDVDPSVATKPNIYMIYIESFRADALTPEITPYLYHLQQTDAQPLERVWSCSNGTHLSWFGTFTSRLPLHWADDRDRCREAGWPGLKVFHAWKSGGYELNVYATGALAYRKMGPHFFGIEGDLFKRIREKKAGDPINDKPLSEREVMLVDALEKDILQRGNIDGVFNILALDSSHFYYQWHKDFKPPFTPYYQGKYMPARPDAEELQLVVNKYHNALAWTDTLVKRFCEFLKQEGLYDDAIIIVLGDHGEELQDNGGWLHVSSLEDEQVRVPMLIKWPKSAGRGPTIKDASQLDLLPSLIEYIYGKVPQGVVGRSLWKKSEHTAIVTTAYCGKTNEAMLFARNGYKAYFKWPDYGDCRPKNKIYLSRIVGPDGDVELESPEACMAAIKKYFPDAPARIFKKFKLEAPEKESTRR